MAIAFALFFFTVACNAPTNDAAAKATETAKTVVAQPDMAKIKAEIKAIEDVWASASNAKDVATIAGFYADDAISMNDDKPMFVGKAAIQKGIEAEMAKQKENQKVVFETLLYAAYRWNTDISTAASVTSRPSAPARWLAAPSSSSMKDSAFFRASSLTAPSAIS